MIGDLALLNGDRTGVAGTQMTLTPEAQEQLANRLNTLLSGASDNTIQLIQERYGEVVGNLNSYASGSGRVEPVYVEDLLAGGGAAAGRLFIRKVIGKALTNAAKRKAQSKLILEATEQGGEFLDEGLRMGVNAAKGSTTVSETAIDILKPGGELIGTQIGRNAAIRTITQQEAETTVKRLIASGAKLSPKPGYPGNWYKLPDGGSFGVRNVVSNKSLRLGSTGAIDLNIPGIALKNLKY